MAIALITTAAVLAGLVFAFSIFLGGVGLVGALTGGRLERCPRCHRFTLCVGGKMHEKGCPGLHLHLAHVRQTHRFRHPPTGA